MESVEVLFYKRLSQNTAEKGGFPNLYNTRLTHLKGGGNSPNYERPFQFRFMWMAIHSSPTPALGVSPYKSDFAEAAFDL
ncbi:Hypothetical protein NTJ_10480 [Nesidiocoris tenuis]|uniref:Uncharacterized protein n=1 Tax=Nesidiocoris tenuis TaxID=355587 RepID=A0ABN7B3B7_9HEMI|nr:Hypothetical protein NTJ_10480 [Nesidiocoris tenuis]